MVEDTLFEPCSQGFLPLHLAVVLLAGLVAAVTYIAPLVNSSTFAAVAGASGDPAKLAKTMADAAQKVGSTDDVTVVVMRLGKA
jgi:serine/threonine protein phosphatase PrpC